MTLCDHNITRSAHRDAIFTSTCEQEYHEPRTVSASAECADQNTSRKQNDKMNRRMNWIQVKINVIAPFVSGIQQFQWI